MTHKRCLTRVWLSNTCNVGWNVFSILTKLMLCVFFLLRWCLSLSILPLLMSFIFSVLSLSFSFSLLYLFLFPSLDVFSLSTLLHWVHNWLTDWTPMVNHTEDGDEVTLMYAKHEVRRRRKEKKSYVCLFCSLRLHRFCWEMRIKQAKFHDELYVDSGTHTHRHRNIHTYTNIYINKEEQKEWFKQPVWLPVQWHQKLPLKWTHVKRRYTWYGDWYHERKKEETVKLLTHQRPKKEKQDTKYN